jgi:hypothetical protein
LKPPLASTTPPLASPLLNQGRQFCVGHDLHAALEQGQQQAADQGVAHDQPRAPRPEQAVPGVPSDDAQRVFERGPALRQSQQVKDVVAVHHHAAQHGELGDRGTNQGQGSAQQAAVKRNGLDGPPAQGSAFQFRQVVWVQRPHLVLHIAVMRQLGHGSGSVVQKGLAQTAIGAFAHCEV